MIKLNGEKISTRKFKILFGESATKWAKKMMKIADCYLCQETKQGFLEIIGVCA